MEKIDSKRTLAGIVAVYISGIFGFVAMPLLVGSTVQAFGVREGTAGIVMGIELSAVAFSCLLLSFTIRKVNARLAVFIAMAAFLVGNAISVWTALGGNSWTLFVVARAITGLSEGFLMAGADAMAAGRREPERAYSVMQVGEVVAAVLVFLGIMSLVKTIGPAGAFAAVGGVGLIALPFLLWFPKRGGMAGAESLGSDQKNTWDILLSRTAILLLLGGGIFGISFSGLWAYVERIGVSLDLSLPKITVVLIAANALAVLGPVVAGLLGTRYGRTMPIIGGSLLMIACFVAVVYTHEPSLYVLSVVIMMIAAQFGVPYLKGLPAFYDPTGRLNAAWLVPTVIGAALGPIVAGLILNAGGTYKSLGWMAVIFTVVVIALIFRPMRQADLIPEGINGRGD